MSACISAQGEYSEHVVSMTGRAADRFLCSRCWVLDEDRLMDALDAAEAAVALVQALHQREWAGHGPDSGEDRGAFCAHCSDLKRDYVPWPCPTRAALDGAS